jgi:hypothetical protein
MKPDDSQTDLAEMSVPELIKHLWDLYLSMSLDPALLESAEHIREAVLSLETTRRLAYQVALEAAQSLPCQETERRTGVTSAPDHQAETEWQDAPRTSATKH